MDLNLARKWRSQSFDGIIGQSLAVRMLKNSLYLDKFFPVYLMSGQRGCGKTTTARVFAAAVNCEQLTQFQKDPKNASVPCRICSSCELFLQGRHPDFIEIDAASYTGVDNVRQIIEAASLLPLMGRKKIYLIDEAHMLSKAAFNAFLKILEEPPRSVFFILATTDPHKIIDTVRSRCFQIFFQPIAHTEIVAHLRQMCQQESIQADDEALGVIAVHTEGSARDAINLLERVRFAHKIVSKQAVLDLLGSVDDEHFIQLFGAITDKDLASIMSWLSKYAGQERSAPILWDGFLELMRALTWRMNGVTLERFYPHAEALSQLTTRCTLKQLAVVMELFYQHELIFLKTTHQHRLFESLIIQLCQHSTVDQLRIESSGQPKTVKPVQVKPEVAAKSEAVTQPIVHSADNRWSRVVAQIENLDDPLVSSLFKKGRFGGAQDGKLLVHYAKDFIFFKDWLLKSEALWQPIIKATFGEVVIEPLFTDESAPAVPVRAAPIKQVSAQPPQERAAAEKKTVPVASGSQQPRQQYYSPKKEAQKEITKSIDISDKEQWKKAHLILSVFPGTISEVPQ